jgi:hypothetical protein
MAPFDSLIRRCASRHVVKFSTTTASRAPLVCMHGISVTFRPKSRPSGVSRTTTSRSFTQA